MEKEKNIRRLQKDLEENRSNLEQTSKEIKGYGRVISNIIDPKTKDINFDNISISNTKSISSTLFNMKGRDSLTGNEISELLYAQISGANDLNQEGLEELIMAQRHSYKEYDFLVREMPEIQRALDLMATDVVYPNAFGKSGIKIEFRNNNEKKNGEKYSELIKYLRPLEDMSLTMSSKRLYSYDIETEAQERVKSTMKYGATLVVSVPYSNIANDLLYDAYKTNKKLGEHYTPFKEDTSFYYDDLQKDVLDRLQASYENKQNKQMESFKSAMGESGYRLNKIINTPESTYGYDFIDSSFYSQGDVDELVNVIASEASNPEFGLVSDNENHKPNTGNGDMFEYMSSLAESRQDVMFTDQEFQNLQELKEKRKLRFNIDKIRGCTHDVLDLKKVLPLFIKNELMGVLAIKEENEFSNQRLGTSLKMLLSQDQVDRYSLASLDTSTKARMKSIILDDMGNTLRRNIDKRLLRNNPTLLEDIEYLLEESKIENLLKTRVRFIPAEYITLYRVGEGNMGTSFLEKAKAYIHSAINLKKVYELDQIFLNKNRFIFKTPHTNDSSIATMVKNAVRLFRNTMPTFGHLANADIINNTLASRSVVIVPQTPNKEDVFSIERLDQTTTEPPDKEFLDTLRNNATSHFGYPADVLDPNSNIDFAKKISHINLTTAQMVLTMQRLLTLPLSEECTRRIRGMTGNNLLECIVTFEPPRELMDEVIGDMLNQTNTIAEVYEKIIDEDTSIEKDNKEIAKYYIREELLRGLIDLKLIDKVKERYSIEGVPSPEDVE